MIDIKHLSEVSVPRKRKPRYSDLLLFSVLHSTWPGFFLTFAFSVLCRSAGPGPGREPE